MANVRLRKIHKSFGATGVLRGVDLDVHDGEFLTLVGPSGCGKSTMLRIIAGLEPQDAGTVEIGASSVDHLRPHERKVAMVFQSYALYPHMSVASNIGLPLVMADLSLWERLPILRHLSPRRRRVMEAIGAKVRKVADQLQIAQLLERRPGQLSGGQRQRVALGRAMVREPDVFLMDEPLSNLDAKLRVHMRAELAELHARLGATFIYVTHDQVEAMTMSDRVAVMEAGEILQIGKPAELYDRPANLQVAQFIGSPAINVLPAKVGPGGEVDLFGRIRLPIRLSAPARSALSVGLRPEVLQPRGEPAPGECVLDVQLRRSENLGPERILHVVLPEMPDQVLFSRTAAGEAELGAPGALLRLCFPPAACHLFDQGGQRIEPADGGRATSQGSKAALQSDLAGGAS